MKVNIARLNKFIETNHFNSVRMSSIDFMKLGKDFLCSNQECEIIYNDAINGVGLAPHQALKKIYQILSNPEEEKPKAKISVKYKNVNVHVLDYNDNILFSEEFITIAQAKKYVQGLIAPYKIIDYRFKSPIVISS